MTKGKYSLDYHACTKSELKAFLQAREVDIEARTFPKLKAQFEDVLVSLDEKVTFRFFDLAPELRNLVYRELLSLRTGRAGSRICWPQILCASKQTYSECHGILYGYNDFEINLSQKLQWTRGGRLSHGKSYVAATGDTRWHWKGKYVSLHEVCQHWPGHLRNAHNLRVVIDLECLEGTSRQAPPNAFNDVNFLLYSVCCFLVKSSRLKKLEVQLKVSDFPGFNDIAGEFLWPLTKLGPRVDCKIIGLPVETVQLLLDEMRETSPQSMNALAIATAAHGIVSDLARIRYVFPTLVEPEEYALLRAVEQHITARHHLLPALKQNNRYLTRDQDNELVSFADQLNASLSQGRLADALEEAKRKIRQLCREIRRKGTDVSILFLSANLLQTLDD